MNTPHRQPPSDSSSPAAPQNDILGRQARSVSAVVTCGPTREPIDSVRFLSNRSSGVLGIEIAKALIARGVAVTLIHGPIEAEFPTKARRLKFETALELMTLLKKQIAKHNLLFMAAAVSDFRPRTRSGKKIKRAAKPALRLSLIANPDILKSLAAQKKGVWVGFSVESENLIGQARIKLKEKNLDLILAQSVGAGRHPFGRVKLNSLLLGRGGFQKKYQMTGKEQVAKEVVEEALRRLEEKQGPRPKKDAD